jgi:hypothetical protein
MISGNVVKEPCPISAAGDTIVIAPSVAIVIQALGDKDASAAAASLISVRGSAASVNAKLKPAADDLRRSRRLMWLFMA